MFNMDIADPVPLSLATYMADKKPVWDAIVKKYNLLVQKTTTSMHHVS